MGRRHSSYNYNRLPPAPLVPEPPPSASPLRGLLSTLMSGKSGAPAHFSLPSIPVGELMGGVSNTVRGLVLNDNWWIILLFIFLFFPSVSKRMFGGILKD